MKKILTLIVIAILSAGMVTGCGRSKATGEAATEPGTGAESTDSDWQPEVAPMPDAPAEGDAHAHTEACDHDHAAENKDKEADTGDADDHDGHDHSGHSH